MKRCKVKTGFFIQKECGAVAVAQCSNCKKSLCIDHLYGGLKTIQEHKASKDEKNEILKVKAKADDKPLLCLECYAQKNKEELKKQYEKEGYNPYDSSDLLWYFYMRDRLYHETHFHPFSDKDSLQTTSQDFDDDSSSSSFFDS